VQSATRSRTVDVCIAMMSFQQVDALLTPTTTAATSTRVPKFASTLVRFERVGVEWSTSPLLP
jgi:hypothetical protein